VVFKEQSVLVRMLMKQLPGCVGSFDLFNRVCERDCSNEIVCVRPCVTQTVVGAGWLRYEEEQSSLLQDSRYIKYLLLGITLIHLQ